MEEEFERLGLPLQFGSRSPSISKHKLKKRKILYGDEGEVVFVQETDVDYRPVESDLFSCKGEVLQENSDASISNSNISTLDKFYAQRYRLFSKFDEGIKMDDESWFSVTPEKIAEHIADRCACNIIVDAFCGVGGNAIQFAKTCELVIAIDIDPLKLAYAKNNAKIYGVDDRIEFVLGDSLQLLPFFNGFVDGVFLSPPWGGPDYLKKEVYNLEEMGPFNGIDILRLALGATENVAFFVPRNSDPLQLVQHIGSGTFEMEKNYLGDKWKTSTAYFGNFRQ